MLGTFILWFGWFGFNAGPALLSSSIENAGTVASLAGLNTSLSGGTAGIVALWVNYVYLHRTTGDTVFDLKYAMNGALTGLASISAGCGVVEPWAAIVTGAVSGVLYNISSRFLVHIRLDDAVEAIPVHLAGGTWGVIAVGFFASPTKLALTYENSDHPGWFYDASDGTLLGTQLLGLLFIYGWCTCIMFPYFWFLMRMGWFRSDPLEEIVGLDRSYHGGMYLQRGQTELHELGEPDSESLSAFEEQKILKRSRHGSLTSSIGALNESEGEDNETKISVERASHTKGDEESKEDDASVAATKM